MWQPFINYHQGLPCKLRFQVSCPKLMALEWKIRCSQRSIFHCLVNGSILQGRASISQENVLFMQYHILNLRDILTLEGIIQRTFDNRNKEKGILVKPRILPPTPKTYISNYIKSVKLIMFIWKPTQAIIRVTTRPNVYRCDRVSTEILSLLEFC